MTHARSFAASFLLIAATVFAEAPDITIRDKAAPDTFPLVSAQPTSVVYDAGDAKVVQIASGLLARDIERVTNKQPDVLTSVPAGATEIIVVGTLGQSRFVDQLVAARKLDAAGIQGRWESFLITVVDHPFDGVDRALVIAGADRRGTAFGVFTLSEAIGVSPWYYWADVPTHHRGELHVVARPFVQGSPSVKYRGIFINDEEWGMHPWAAFNMDTDLQDIGPRAYAKIFELLLRLKANYIWPAMHRCTRAFNLYPENRQVADDYAIVMGASHCEPMLRNNVTEWYPLMHGEWNYETNRDGVCAYWEARLKTNGIFENVYTVGMRGIHDSDMPGGGTMIEKRDRLALVIRDQRRLLARYVNPDPASVPQIFCPYKEVLAIYEQGLALPDDITIVWPDDNFGYIRNLSTPAERRRSGGSGVYYHLSYRGGPQDWLWLSSTPPTLIAYELQKAYAYGSDRVWVFNVGDLKPAEMEMDFALRLAYDIDSWPVERASEFIEQWAKRTCGPAYATEIAKIEKEYYRLTQQVKPEHVDRVRFSPAERAKRRAAYAALVAKAEAIEAKLAPECRDSFFQLVRYPVTCAAMMTEKQTCIVEGDAKGAMRAYDRIWQLSRHYNKKIAGGKWNGMMYPSPAERPVFRRPAARQIRKGGGDPTYIRRLAPRQAELEGAMNIVDGRLVASVPGKQRSDTTSRATFTFKAPQAENAVVYFLANCPDDNHDSWFVTLNGQSAVCNDNVTGDELQWVRAAEGDLVAGRNTLVIAQREPDAAIEAVAIVKPGPAPTIAREDPLHVIPADACAKTTDSSVSQWQTIDCIGIERRAMTVLPYETASISVNNLATAPAITYRFAAEVEACTIEARFVPTHRIHKGMGLRYAISVDGDDAQIRDINAPEWSRVWSGNVLRGYAKGSTHHRLNKGADHTITVRLLDPGMVLSQVRVY